MAIFLSAKPRSRTLLMGLPIFACLGVFEEEKRPSNRYPASASSVEPGLSAKTPIPPLLYSNPLGGKASVEEIWKIEQEGESTKKETGVSLRRLVE